MIYDSDALAYRAAAVVDQRSVKITHKQSGKSRVFKNRTEHKEGLLLKGKPFDKNDWLFEDKVQPGELSHCLKILKNQIENINDRLFADEYLMCIQGKTNFRDRLPLPSQYKGSRVDLARPTHLKEAKMYLYKNHPSLVAKDRECDDDVIIQGYLYLSKGYTPILVSQDKDAFAYSELNLYDFTQEDPKIRLIPFFGSLWDTGKKITGEGFLWFCMQLLNGDSTDNYKPCELAGVKFGEASAFKILKNCTNEKDALNVVINKYKEWYPEPFEYKDWTGTIQKADYKFLLDLYFKCARMMKHEKDKLDSVKFLDQYGINL